MTAVASGADIVSGGFGFLDSSSTFSLEAIPVDAEIAAMARRMAHGIEVTPETLMGDAIRRVGIGGDFLKEKDTRTRVRAGEHFCRRSGRGCRSSSGSPRGARRPTPRADAVRAALAARAGRGPRLGEDQRRELAEICGIGPADVV